MKRLLPQTLLLLLCLPGLAAEMDAPVSRAGKSDLAPDLSDLQHHWALEVQLPDKSIVRIDPEQDRLPFSIVLEPPQGPAVLRHWSGLGKGPLADLHVVLRFVPGDHLQMRVENKGKRVALRSITFPVIDLPVTDADSILIPSISGRLHEKPLTKRLQARGDYPGGWLTMQCAGLYGPKGGTYVGVHDPYASTKRLEMDTKDGHLRIQWTWPAPDCGVPGNAWKMPGDVVIRPFDGDWYDFAQIYREWVSEEAKWWPRGSQVGRPDTPGWMKDISVWALTGGGADQVVKSVTKFAKYLGVPTALHWYNWHQIPFDNDYPHYFPAKAGFADGVKRLQAAGVRVMPYINGRLWDTDLEDFKTTGIAAATKNEKGEPYTEQYGSGQKLAAMCPTTPLWQKTVRDIVLRLTGPEFNVDGVYVDQIAAARPRLCFDKSHGHPLAGGNWWTTRGYWPMLTDLRKQMAAARPGKMITTECNAEPYVHLFDGYLTWHFQDDSAIPLFAAVYGGQVQLFSRAYQGDSWKGLAMRQKTAQALCWGEQLGWISPAVVDDPVAGPFLKRLAHLRYDLRQYLGRGRMARPPAIKTDGATVTADWQWHGKRIVTTAAVLSGAWQAADGALALIFVNVDENPHAFDLNFDGAAYGFSRNLLAREHTGLENHKSLPGAKPLALKWQRRITLEPTAALAIELRRAK
jgi:hypothetical protein